MGVDGIYSDHVDRLVAAVGEWTAGWATARAGPRSLSGQIFTKARPTMALSSMAWKNVESRESCRLSPST